MVSQKPKYCKNFERNSHWRKLSMIMVWERYSNASPKPEFFLFSLFIFSFISQLICVRLGRDFHRWFSIQKQVNRCTIDSFSLKFCTSQQSYPVPLSYKAQAKETRLSQHFLFCCILLALWVFRSCVTQNNLEPSRAKKYWTHNNYIWYL